jgi:C4-dicarboxylate-specific signal transduction histidine kinase
MGDRAAPGRWRARRRASALAGALLAAALATAGGPSATAASRDVAAPVGVPRGALASGLAPALALAGIEAGAIVLLLLTMRRRRQADASACRDLLELARLTREGATREMGRSLVRQMGTPLTSALNNLGAARRLLLRDPPQLEEISAAVGEAQSAGERVAAVLHSLCPPSPAARSSQALVDLNDVVREGVRLVAGLRSAAISAELSRLPPIQGVRVELLQVVLALLLNGVEEASAAGGGPVVIRTRAEGDVVELLVEHPGAGAFEPERAGLAGPFLAPEPTGLGTGLDIARSIVESYGGRFSVELSSRGPRFVPHRATVLRARFERATGVE